MVPDQFDIGGAVPDVEGARVFSHPIATHLRFTTAENLYLKDNHLLNKGDYIFIKVKRGDYYKVEVIDFVPGEEVSGGNPSIWGGLIEIAYFPMNTGGKMTAACIEEVVTKKNEVEKKEVELKLKELEKRLMLAELDISQLINNNNKGKKK